MYYWHYWNAYCNYWLKNLESIRPEAPTNVDSPQHSERDELSTQQKYEYLTQYGTQALCLLHPEQGCIYLSRNFHSITGKNIADCMGQMFYEHLHEDSAERIRQLINGEAETNSFPHTLHLKLRHADGHLEWYSCMIRPDEKEHSDSYVCILENINTHVESQNILHKAKLEAELALSTRSEFLANMSHDLRTPLNAVIGFAQIIEEQMFGEVNAQYLEYTRHIQESGHDLLSKVEDLLEIASIDAGRASLDRQDVYLNTMLQHVIANHAHQTAAMDILIDYAPPVSGDILLNVDRMKLQHIVGHLLTNAIRFSHRGGKITIEAKQTPQKEVILRIADHGVGINETKLKEIRNAMQEGNAWGTGGGKAIGLGLALTREFVAMHGGEIEINSAIGDGTTIDITLPEECLSNTPHGVRNYAHLAG